MGEICNLVIGRPGSCRHPRAGWRKTDLTVAATEDVQEPLEMRSLPTTGRTLPLLSDVTDRVEGAPPVRDPMNAKRSDVPVVWICLVWHGFGTELAVGQMPSGGWLLLVGGLFDHADNRVPVRGVRRTRLALVLS